MPQISIINGSDIGVNAASLARRMPAENLSPRTIQAYGESVRQFVEHLTSVGMPQNVADIRRDHIECFINNLFAKFKPATAANRRSGLQRFSRWAVEEDEIKGSRLEKTKPPRMPKSSPEVLRYEQLKGLFATRDKDKSSEEKRDAALLRVLVDIGARLAEVTDLRWVPG